MKKLCLFVLFVFSFGIAHSNVTPMSSAYISELYFDENGDWIIELYFDYFNENDIGYVMVTSTDTATFEKYPDSTNILLLTNADLSNPLIIDQEGDKVWFENPENYLGGMLTSPCVFGNFPGASVTAPYPGQSIVGVSYKHVKDTSSSLGYLRDPAKGVVRGYATDSIGNPLPYIQIQTQGFGDRTIWSDENGFFTDTVYAKKYSIFIINNNNRYRIYDSSFSIEPDSTTIHNITLAVSAEIEFSGHCYLADADDHSGTRIILRPQCPFATVDTIFTDSTGYFSKSIPLGHYKLRYSHQGYLPYFSLSYLDMFFDFSMNDTYLEEGIVHEIAGKIEPGVWLDDYPYWIFNDVYLLADDTLTIDPGVEIVIKRWSNWDVYGTLLANGKEDDSITIKPDAYTNWGNFNFHREISSNSVLKYVDISFQKSMNFYQSSATIENTRISWNGDVRFYDSASPKISECRFENGLWLYCYDNSAPHFYRNTFRIKINCYDQSSPLFEKNIYLINNILCLNESKPLIRNNDFYDTWAPIVCLDNAIPEIEGNVFVRGGYAADCSHGKLPHIIKYNVFHDLYDEIIWTYGQGIPGLGVLDTVNNNNDSCDIYFNLLMDPMFADPENDDFSLDVSSPCIDAGNPEFDYDPDTTISDIGAYYFNQTNVFVNDWKTHFHAIKVYHYPNPLNENVHFVIDGNEINDVKNAVIMIYDLSGIKTGELQCPFIDKGFGKKIYNYNCGSFKAGTYIYTLEINGQAVASNKMIIVR